MEVPSYEPEHISVLLSSMISEAVPALLDQHDRYDINQLVQYLARNYPGIPAQMRAPVVIAATAGARQAALWHTVWEKNVASEDVNKRRLVVRQPAPCHFGRWGCDRRIVLVWLSIL